MSTPHPSHVLVQKFLTLINETQQSPDHYLHTLKKEKIHLTDTLVDSQERVTSVVCQFPSAKSHGT